MINHSTIYGNVYNFYQNYFTPKSSSRYDSHKKSELKGIYNSIVNQSKEDSVFMLDRSPTTQRYSISMKESALQFERDITALGGSGADKLFEQKSAYSSDPSIADVEYLPDAKISEDSDPIKLTVDTLAKPQINHGDFLSSDTLDLDTGSYSFDISTSMSNYELQFNIGDNDTNLSIQTRLARLINNSSIGLSAMVEHSGNSSALVVSSTSAGPSADGTQPFSISDENTSQNRGIVDYLGIRNVTQPATWANYTINGDSYFSPENHIEINNIFSVTLKGENKIGDEPVTISAKADYESLKDNIIGIAGAYNRFLKTASEYLEEQPRTSILIDSMKRMERYYSSTMEKLGITRNEDGSLNIDEDSLKTSLQEHATSEDIDSMKDFTKSAYRKISHVQLNPMDYVDKRIVAYKNPLKTHYANPYITSAYSGMMFNSYM